MKLLLIINLASQTEGFYFNPNKHQWPGTIDLITNLAFKFLKCVIRVNIWSGSELYATSNWYTLVHESSSFEEMVYSLIGRLKQAQVKLVFNSEILIYFSFACLNC